MTIPSNVTRNSYNGTGITGPYPVTFKFFEDADLRVTVADADGVETVKTLTTDYTVTGAGEQAGGSITFTTAVTNGYSIVIEPKADLTQDTDIKNEGGNLRESLEDRFDRLCRDDQVQQNLIDRSVKMQTTDASVADPVLPPREAGSLIGWSDDGLGFANRSASLFSADAAITSTGSTEARWISDRFAEVANVRDFGAAGNGTDDDTSAVSAAVAAGKTVYFPAGTYLITSQITIATEKQCLFGDGPQSIIRRANAVGVNFVFYATAISDIRLTSLRFEVASDTAHTQVGGFIAAASCENLTVDLCQFMCANGSGLPTLFSCVNTPSCNQVLIHGNLFYRAYGNCCGANDGVGSSVNGNHVIVSNNRIIDSIDTGIGSWTGAREVVIVGNVLTSTYTGVAYSKVGIDVAGASRVTITGNSVDGHTIGVRVATNLNYTNQDIIISSNVFGNHRTNTGEPAQAIKISHDDYSGGGSPTASISVIDNSFTMSGTEIGVDVISSVTDTTKKLTVRVDGNTFRKTGGTSYAIYFQKLSTYGCLDIIPGENAFAGGVDYPVSGNMPDNRGSEVGGHSAVWSRDEFTLSGSATVDFGRMYLKPGLYALFVTHGTMTDAAGVGASVGFETYPGAVSVAGTVFAAANQNTSWTPVFAQIATAGQYQLRWFPHPATNTHQIRSISLVRLM